jgi:hypothetical protein
MKVTHEGLRVATLRAGLRRALKGTGEVKLAQRGEETYLVRQVGKWGTLPAEHFAQLTVSVL